jgi:RNA polymerase sigma-70 factor (ECF subfamily)
MTHSAKDSKLIEQAVRDFQAGKDREKNAGLIFEKCAPKVVKLLRWHLSQRKFKPEDIEEITIKVFESVYEHMHKFRHESAFDTWVLRIAKHKALDEARSRDAILGGAATVSLNDAGEDGRRLAETIADPSPESDPDDAARGAELSRAVEESINAMPARMRQCMMLRVYQELSYEEIALVMKIKVDSVKPMLHQGKVRLLQDLKAKKLI